MNRNRGFAALLIIFILGMVSILVASGLILTGYNESQMARSGASGTSAYYAANSGVEDAIYKLNFLTGFAASTATTDRTYTIPGTLIKPVVTVAHDPSSSKQRIIDSVATIGPFVSHIHAIVKNTIVTPGFLFALQAGNGGIEMEQQSLISGASGADGDIYSRGDIKGKDNNHNGAGECQNSASAIAGTARARGSIDQLAGGSGICVSKDVYADDLKFCFVTGTRNYYTQVNNANCSGIVTPANKITPTPTPIDLPDMGIDSLKTTLQDHGTIWTQNGGNCNADGSNGSWDCTKGTKILKNYIIPGTLIIDPPTHQTITIEGPVWVKGDVTIKSNSSSTIPSIKPGNVAYSQMMVVDGKITSDSGVTFGTGGGGTIFLLFISTFAPAAPYADLCDTPAMTIHSNTFSVLFYATQGCAEVITTASTAYQGALLGEKIHVNNNTNVIYDPKLQGANFATTALSGWQIASFRQD